MPKANTDLPNFELLIKLLNLASDSRGNDNMALQAFRKACDQLARCNMTWESLLKGKVTIMGNPFGDIPFVKPTPRTVHKSPPPTYRPPPPPEFTCMDCGRHAPLSQKHTRGSSSFCTTCARDYDLQRQAKASLRPNQYGGKCHSCHSLVPPQGGTIDKNPTGKWEITCASCATKTTTTQAAPKSVRPDISQL